MFRSPIPFIHTIDHCGRIYSKFPSHIHNTRATVTCNNKWQYECSPINIAAWDIFSLTNHSIINDTTKMQSCIYRQNIQYKMCFITFFIIAVFLIFCHNYYYVFIPTCPWLPVSKGCACALQRDVCVHFRIKLSLKKLLRGRFPR